MGISRSNSIWSIISDYKNQQTIWIFLNCHWFNFSQVAKDAIQLQIEREEHAKEQARLEQMREEKALLQREEEERRKVS